MEFRPSSKDRIIKFLIPIVFIVQQKGFKSQAKGSYSNFPIPIRVPYQGTQAPDLPEAMVKIKYLKFMKDM
jgi:hypothetical protein